MSKRLEVLLASRSKQAITDLATDLREASSYKIETRHIQNGHANPLYEVRSIPDVVVMLLNDTGHNDLEALIGEQTPGGPPMIVVAENGDAKTMRLAMRAGARDFLTGAVAVEDFVESIDRVADQLVETSTEHEANLTIFVNAKGGSGATFLACNTAHILKSVSEQSTALMSLDLQFDGLSQYFDTELRHGLMEVLDSVDSLDDVALDAYMTQHESGLRMLAAVPEDKIQCHSDRADHLGVLLDKMLAHYDHVVVDMPRRIDPYMVPVLERATRIVLVVQQTLGHLRDATRMLQIFGAYGISSRQVLVVVNRYDKNAPISSDDIKRALKGTEVSLVPSDFKTVAESINLGVPMHEHARGSGVTKALTALETQVGGSSAKIPTGFFGKAFSHILRKDKWSRA
jgi:pilus assembly protein CpaE